MTTNTTLQCDPACSICGGTGAAFGKRCVCADQAMAFADQLAMTQCPVGPSIGSITTPSPVCTTCRRVPCRCHTTEQTLLATVPAAASPKLQVYGTVCEIGQLEDEGDLHGIVLKRAGGFVTIKGLAMEEVACLGPCFMDDITVNFGATGAGQNAEVAQPDEQPLIGKLLDKISQLEVLWGLNEPGALLRFSDVSKVLFAAAKAAAPTLGSAPQADEQSSMAGATRQGGATCNEALRLFLGAAYPVAPDINPRGYNWSEAYLDQARAAALAAPVAQEGNPVIVKVERNHVWIIKGVQSFMLAYEADTEEELNWYANQLRTALLSITPCVKPDIWGAQEGEQSGGPLNGIPPTMRHDEGAIAQCSYCGRYSIDPATLSGRQPVCECGQQHGWSGSFKRPSHDAKWSGKAPAAAPSSTDASVQEGDAQ
jgi:hypothetical protein